MFIIIIHHLNISHDIYVYLFIYNLNISILVFSNKKQWQVI